MREKGIWSFDQATDTRYNLQWSCDKIPGHWSMSGMTGPMFPGELWGRLCWEMGTSVKALVFSRTTKWWQDANHEPPSRSPKRVGVYQLCRGWLSLGAVFFPNRIHGRQWLAVINQDDHHGVLHRLMEILDKSIGVLLVGCCVSEVLHQHFCPKPCAMIW